MMKKILPIQITFLSFLILFASTSFAQTFWGMTSTDGTYGGGSIFSFDAKTDTYQTEYWFKPNPVYVAINVFEQSLGVYIGVCQRSYANGIYENQNHNYLYRYDAIRDTTEIIYEFPGYFTHSQYKNGESDIIYFNNSIIGMIKKDVNNDTMTLINYSVLNKTITEIAGFNTASWPGDGLTSYSMNNCYFSAANDTSILFSLGKAIQIGSSSISADGRDFFSYNPQNGVLGKIFSTTAEENILPYGPFIKTTNDRLFCQARSTIMELKLADSSYSFVSPFENGNFIIQGKMIQATDSTLVGLSNISTSGYLFEYDFKNDTLVKEYYIWNKAKINAFAPIGDSLYFYSGDNYPQIFAYKPGGDDPKLSYELRDRAEGYIDYLIPISDQNSLLTFYSGMAQYFPDKRAYVPGVRFGGTGTYYSYKYGATPSSDLLLASNGKLYGTTANGGLGSFYYGDGVLFEIDPESKKFQLLLNFTGENGGFGDRDSYGSHYGKHQNNLIEVNQKLYGTTYVNGDYADKHTGPGYGVIYTYDISKNEDNYRKIVDFNDSTDASAGRLPLSGLTLGANGKLYGTTVLGGISGIYGHGVVYEIDPNDSDQFRVVMEISETDLRSIDNLILADNGKLYGLASGAEYTSDPKQWAIREYDVENASYTDLFTSELSNYEYNYSQFTLLNNKLYGVVSRGNDASNGYIFEFDITTQQLVKKIVFASNSEEGAKPEGNLTLSSSGSFWGMTSSGGVHSDDWGDYNKGVIYEFDPVEGSYTKHYDFGGIGGLNPIYTSLIETAGVDYTGIDSSISEERIRAYPNPTADFVHFDLENNSAQKVDYSIFDISGKRILSETLDVQNYLIVDLSGFRTGIYVVKINTDKQSFSKTIIRK